MRTWSMNKKVGFSLIGVSCFAFYGCYFPAPENDSADEFPHWHQDGDSYYVEHVTYDTFGDWDFKRVDDSKSEPTPSTAPPTEAAPHQQPPQKLEQDMFQCRDKYRRLGLSDVDVKSTLSNQCRMDGSCATQPVSLQYSLDENLGDQWAIVEASESPYFALGSASTSAVITGYRTNQSGNQQATVLQLAPGRYYVRAFLTKAGTVNTALNQPQDQNITVISSTIPLVVLEPKIEACPDPLFLYLDQRIEQINDQPKTNARLRIQMMMDPEGIETLPHNRPLRVGLYATDDFSYAPLMQWDVPSQSLLISGHLGTSEFITPELPLGEYYVMTYLDSNNSDYYDQGELMGIFEDFEGHAQKVVVRQDQAKVVTIDLGYEAIDP